jgi:SAM-dependent methyltransferase
MNAEQEIREIIGRIENGKSREMKVYQDLAGIYHFLYGNTYDYEGQADIAEENTPENVSRVIDGGCGTGGLTGILAERFPEAEVLGVDLNSSMLEIARENTSEENLEFRQKDILDLEDETDVLTFFGTTPHLEKNELQRLFAKIHDLLSRNGVFVFDFKSPDVKKHEDGHCSIWSRETENYEVKNPITTVYQDGEPYYVFSFQFTEKDSGEEYYAGDIMQINLYTREELEDMLEKSGFRDIKFLEEGDQSGIFVARKKK